MPFQPHLPAQAIRCGLDGRAQGEILLDRIDGGHENVEHAIAWLDAKRSADDGRDRAGNRFGRRTAFGGGGGVEHLPWDDGGGAFGGGQRIHVIKWVAWVPF